MGIVIKATRTTSGSTTYYWANAKTLAAGLATFGEGWQVTYEVASRKPAGAINIKERI